MPVKQTNINHLLNHVLEILLRNMSLFPIRLQCYKFTILLNIIALILRIVKLTKNIPRKSSNDLKPIFRVFQFVRKLSQCEITMLLESITQLLFIWSWQVASSVLSRSDSSQNKRAYIYVLTTHFQFQKDQEKQ